MNTIQQIIYLYKHKQTEKMVMVIDQNYNISELITELESYLDEPVILAIVKKYCLYKGL